MITKHLPSLLALLTVLSALGLAAPASLAATDCPNTNGGDFPDPPSSYTHTADQLSQGAWDDPDTWTLASGVTDQTPGDDAVVCIPAGRRVTVQDEQSADVTFVRVDGELRLWIHSDTQLRVETLYVGPYDAGQAQTGIFRIGDVNHPVKPGKTAKVVFLSDGNHPKTRSSWDPKQLSRGFVSDGQVRIFGQEKTHMYTVSSDALAGTDSLSLDLAAGETVPDGWNVGDDVVLTGTYFRRTGSDTSSRDERRTLTSISGSSIGFSDLSHDHLRPDSSLDLHVANLTRNVVFSSESTAAASDHGHVMFRDADVDVRHTAFVDVGRTDKKNRLDDLTVNQDGTVTLTSPGNADNPRGRYSVHFHHNGIDPSAGSPPSKVYNSVVDGAVGWAFVNHSSHVDFRRNVAYDFDGAGFVTEAGNELGNFFDNIAIRGIGNGQYRPSRIVFANGQREQPLSDFGFSGDGFWFQGPALRVRDNVANGCDGAGMIWFTTGAPVFDDVGGDGRNRYAGFDRSDAETVYGLSSYGPTWEPRHWNHGVGDSKLVISDLPILEMDGFTGYANLVGFKIRFNNHDNVDWYKEDPFHYEDHIVALVPGDKRYAKRLRQDVENLTLWNNEQGFRVRYNTKTDWSGVTVYNHLGYDTSGAPFRGHSGGEFNFQILDSTMTGVAIEGYPVAGWVENRSDAVRNQFTLSNLSYDDYAEADTWNKGNPDPDLTWSCTAPDTLSASTGSTSATLSWSGTNSHDDRFLVRYREQVNPDNEAWRMVDTTGTSVQVTGLQSSTYYDFQVVAACCDDADSGNDCDPAELQAVSAWSGEKGFQTN